MSNQAAIAMQFVGGITTIMCIALYVIGAGYGLLAGRGLWDALTTPLTALCFVAIGVIMWIVGACGESSYWKRE